MDMEMADYEKLVKELNHKLSERDRQMQEHEMHIQTQKEREQRLNEEIGTIESFICWFSASAADVVIVVKEPAWGCTGSNTDESHYVLILSESLKLLLDQTEEKASRMKQLLVKTKKDLGDAKQKVSLMNSVSAGVLWMYGVKN